MRRATRSITWKIFTFELTLSGERLGESKECFPLISTGM